MRMINRTFIATAVTLGLIGCSPSMTSEERIQLAESHLAKGEQAAAVIELKNAISDTPDSVGARFLLGSIYLQQGDALSAEKELSRAAELQPDLPGVNAALAKTYYLLTNLEALEDMLTFERNLNDSDRLQVLIYTALIEVAAGNLQKAQHYVSQANDISEEAQYARLGSAWLSSFEEANWDESLSVVDKLLAEDPGFTEALLLKGHLVAAKGDYYESATIYGQYLEKHPQTDYVRMFRVKNLLMAEKYDEVANPINYLVKAYPYNPVVNQLAGHYEFRKGNFEQARIYAENALAQNNGDVVSAMVSGVSAYQLGKMEQAYQTLRPVQDQIPSDHPAQKILTLVKLNLGYLDEASESVQYFDDVNVQESDMLKYAVGQFARLGDVTSARALLDKAQELDPGSAILMTQSGILKMFEGDDSGIQDIQNALKEDPKLVGANVSLIMRYFQDNDLENGIEAINAWKQVDSEVDFPHMLEGMFYSQAGNHEQALSAFQSAYAINPENASTLTFLGFYSAKNAQYEEALDYYQKAVKIQPTAKALQGLELSNRLLKQPQETKQFLLQEHKEKPSNAKIAIAAGLATIRSGETEKGISLLEAYDRENPNHPHVAILLGDIYKEQGQINKAIAKFEQATEVYSESPILALRLIGAYNVAKEYEKGLALTDKTLDKFPDSTDALLLKSHFHIILNQIPEAERAFNRIDERYAAGEFYSQVRGNLSIKKKEFNQSVEAYYEMYRLEPNTKNANNLARALMLSQRPEEAVKVMEGHVEKQPENKIARMLLADYYKDAGQREKVSEQYLMLLKSEPESIVLLNNLAWNELQLGNLDKALEWGDKALAAAPKHETIISTYSSILVASQRHQEALVLMESFLKGNTQSSFDTQYAYAKILMANQQSSKARRVLDDIVVQSNIQKKMVDDLKGQL